MPKARKHKKGTTKKRVSASANHAPPQNSVPTAIVPARPANRAFTSPAVRGPQSLITPAIVALGCWGLVVSFAFFYSSDPNHLLYAGVAAAMALLWSFSFAMRVRKLYMLRQRA